MWETVVTSGTSYSHLSGRTRSTTCMDSCCSFLSYLQSSLSVLLSSARTFCWMPRTIGGKLGFCLPPGTAQLINTIGRYDLFSELLVDSCKHQFIFRTDPCNFSSVTVGILFSLEICNVHFLLSSCSQRKRSYLVCWPVRTALFSVLDRLSCYVSYVEQCMKQLPWS